MGKTIEVIDRFCGQWKRELRDDVLAIHSMAHTVVNGAPLSAAPGDGSLPAAAYSVSEEFREWRESLAAVALLDQIADLEPD